MNRGTIMIFRKKQKADFSAVGSGSSSTAPAQPQASPAQPAQPQAAPAPVAAPASAPAPAAQPASTHTVAKGETLSAIAQRHYGAASKWRVIFEANRDKISDPDRIQPGQVLTIPPAQ
jgi:nucleoid-associated protein YgaU